MTAADWGKTACLVLGMVCAVDAGRKLDKGRRGVALTLSLCAIGGFLAAWS